MNHHEENILDWYTVVLIRPEGTTELGESKSVVAHVSAASMELAERQARVESSYRDTANDSWADAYYVAFIAHGHHRNLVTPK